MTSCPSSFFATFVNLQSNFPLDSRFPYGSIPAFRSVNSPYPYSHKRSKTGRFRQHADGASVCQCSGVLGSRHRISFGHVGSFQFFRPSKYSAEKLTSYECGENPTGSPWIQFNIRFYVFALIFIVFDVEVAFLVPWAVAFKKLGMFAFIEGLIFIAILAVGLAYVWAKGDLHWVRPEERGSAD